MSLANEKITKAYEIVRTVDVLLGTFGTYRIEIVKVLKGSLVEFDAHTYERKSLYRNPDGTISSERATHGVEFYAWVPDYLMWINRPTPEMAFSQILSELAERRGNKNSSW